jgi:hypothetical protein
VGRAGRDQVAHVAQGFVAEREGHRRDLRLDEGFSGVDTVAE